MSSREYRDYLKDQDPARFNNSVEREEYEMRCIQEEYERRMRGDNRTARDIAREYRSPENWVIRKRPPGDW